jgi:hypothetical protein
MKENLVHEEKNIEERKKHHEAMVIKRIQDENDNILAEAKLLEEIVGKKKNFDAVSVLNANGKNLKTV